MSAVNQAPSTPKRVLVTGASGTIGRRVAEALIARGDVVVRVGMRAPSNEPVGAEVVRLDFDAVSTLESAFEGVDAFFFVSPLVEDQVAQSEVVIEAAVRAGVTHCVRLSSRATGWDQVCVLRGWHREVEARIVASGLRHTMLRPCSFMQNVLGPGLAAARATGTFSMPLGGGRIPFVDAVDIGEAAAVCLLDPDTHHGATYVLTGAKALSGDDVAAELQARLGRPVRYAATPPEVARRAARERGIPDWLVESGLRVYAHAEGGYEAEVDEALARLLGRAPRTFAEFAAREIHP